MQTDTTPQHEATYSPEDNKIRIYPACRLDSEEWQELKKIGFKYAPKQGLFVAPRWTPAAEDAALALCGYIGDEDQSQADRAADRAERFGMYREKRIAEATEHADRADGIGLPAHQNASRAASMARKIDRATARALCQWDKAEYWQRRTAGVISHALYKERADVRERRIKKIESDLRKRAKDRKEGTSQAQMRFDIMRRVLDVASGVEEKVILSPIAAGWMLSDYGIESLTEATPEQLRAMSARYALQHFYSGKWSDMRQALVSGERSGVEVAREYLEACPDGRPADYDPSTDRWAVHYNLRLNYERAMLEAVGANASGLDMKKGGTYAGRVLHAINKSNTTKRISSVKVLGQNFRGEPSLVSVKVEGWTADKYSDPTPESLEKMKAEAATLPASSAPKRAKLINPDMTSAQAVQDFINQKAREKYGHLYKGEELHKLDSPVKEMTQAEYSACSQGTYSPYKVEQFTQADCRLRFAPCRRCIYSPGSVIVLTDKPQKPLTIKEEAAV